MKTKRGQLSIRQVELAIETPADTKPGSQAIVRIQGVDVELDLDGDKETMQAQIDMAMEAAVAPITKLLS